MSIKTGSRLYKASRKWNRLVDTYLDFSDEFFATVRSARKRSQSIATESAFIQPESKVMMKFTLVGLFVVFMLVLVSCQIPPQVPNQGRTPFFPQGDRQPEQIYVKRDSQTIRPAESGSKTGSLWNAAQSPRQLFVEPRPDSVGQVVTVNIPDDLQFRLGQEEGGGDEKNEGNVDVSNKMTTAASRVAEPMKSFKMTIVGIEPTGDVYLRGSRSYKSEGRDKNVTVFAKVPRRALSTFEVDAKQLSEVAVTEEGPQIAGRAEYATPGWDQMVSRKLAGFVPDVAAENRAIEEARADLMQFQKSLNDRRKDMDSEAQRVQKDRERLNAEEQRLQENYSPVEAAGDKSDAKSKKPDTKAAAAKPDAKADAKAKQPEKK